jgi:Histidine-specific methyltransferase, SAM-dependent
LPRATSLPATTRRTYTERLAAPLSLEDKTVQSGGRRLADQVAAHAHQVVLRDFRGRRARTRVRPVPGDLLVPLQQLLRSRRAAALVADAWGDQQARGARRRGLQTQRRRSRAEFSRNILRVLNRDLAADFDESAFVHVARDPDREWVEMGSRLLSHGLVVKLVALDLDFTLDREQEIRTEASANFRRAGVESELHCAG